MTNLLRAAALALAMGLGFAPPAVAQYSQDTSGTTQDGILEALTDIAGQTAAKGYTSSVSVTRTADTNAYAAGDVIGAATGSTAALTFASSAPSTGGDLILTSAELAINASALISGETSYALYLYSVTPPSALGDNAAFDIPSGDRASFLGKIALGTPVDEGSTLYIRTDAINAHIKAASGSIYAYLVTQGGYTPTSGRVYKITLHFLAL